MKRNEHLQPLSRQHHNGLLMALLISKGLKKGADPALIREFIISGWNQELKDHFTQEETILIPALQQTSFDPELTSRLLNEHGQIRSIVNHALVGEVDPTELSRFASLLEQHIRFEERVYFPEAEKLLSESQLRELGEGLHEDNSVNCINYPIKFWE